MYWSYNGGHLKFPKSRHHVCFQSFTSARYSDTDLREIQIYGLGLDLHDRLAVLLGVEQYRLRRQLQPTAVFLSRVD